MKRNFRSGSALQKYRNVLDSTDGKELTESTVQFLKKRIAITENEATLENGGVIENFLPADEGYGWGLKKCYSARPKTHL